MRKNIKILIAKAEEVCKEWQAVYGAKGSKIRVAMDDLIDALAATIKKMKGGGYCQQGGGKTE